MTRKLAGTFVLTLFVFAFLAVSSFGADIHEPNPLIGSKYLMLKNKIMGGDEDGYNGRASEYHEFNTAQDLRGVVTPTSAVGLNMGITTYDYQHNGRMARQVAWRGDHRVHFAWMQKNDDVQGVTRITAYQVWMTDEFPADFNFSTTGITGGGTPVHVTGERSGYCGIDVLPVPTGTGPQGRAVVYNHYDLTGSGDGLEYLPTVWPDQGPANGNFSAYKQDVPDALLTGAVTGEFIWPYACTQITAAGDTVMHIVTRESDDNAEFSEIRYFRRVGSVVVASGVWTGMIVDTSSVIAYVVEHAPANAPNRDKVAIVWGAHWPETPGGGESTTPATQALLVEQNQNDIYAMISTDAGVNWGAKHNVTRTDSTVGGFVMLSDMSALIDTTGRLHVVWAARPTGGLEQGATGASALDWEWPLFPFASRVLHWSDEYLGDPNETDYITVVKDGTWDWTDLDTLCVGGAWHSMALNNPMISQCDDKLYVVYAQFQDLDNGIWDNCDVRAFDGDINGSANGMLYFSVSTMNNGGLNWDPGRELTGMTQRCDADGGTTAPDCHSHFWHSVARYGMQNDAADDDFSGATVVDDGWTVTSTDYYLDVAYVDDLQPGGVIQGEGGWTSNPFRWFRVPCVDPVPQPVLAIDPLGVYTPAWNKPGVQVNVPLTLFNIGNSPLTVNSITPNEDAGPTGGWLGVTGSVTSISETVPTNFETVTVNINDGGIINAGLAPAELSGDITVTWETSRTTVFPVDFIVADTVQFPEVDTIYTNSVALAVNNAGGMGLSTIGGEANMDFVHSGLETDECDNGNSNVESRYLAEAAPFLMKITPTDTLVSSYVSSHSWLSRHNINDERDGFRPQESLNDLGTFSGQFNEVVESGIFYSADSSMALQATYYAPLGQADGGNFIGQGFKVWNISGATIDDLYVGQAEDWDIPSDSTVRNSSGYDGSRQLMYQYGWEFTSADTFCPDDPTHDNNVNDANSRYGGSAFIAQWKYEDGVPGRTYSPFQQCVFSYKLSTFFYGGHIGYDSLLQQIIDAGCSGGLTYESTNPPVDSTFMDLFNMAIFGNYSLGVNDTLYFYKVLASKRQDPGQGTAPQEFFGDVDDAINHLKNVAGFCCKVWGVPGDGDTNGAVNVLDIIYAINYKFKGGPNVAWPDRDGNVGPAFACSSLLDADNNGAVNVLDIIFLINYKFKGGPAPVCPL